MSARSVSLGIAPASDSFVALTITITRIVFSLLSFVFGARCAASGSVLRSPYTSNDAAADRHRSGSGPPVALSHRARTAVFDARTHALDENGYCETDRDLSNPVRSRP